MFQQGEEEEEPEKEEEKQDNKNRNDVRETIAKRKKREQGEQAKEDEGEVWLGYMQGASVFASLAHSFGAPPYAVA